MTIKFCKFLNVTIAKKVFILNFTSLVGSHVGIGSRDGIKFVYSGEEDPARQLCVVIVGGIMSIYTY